MALDIEIARPEKFKYSECQKHFIDLLWDGASGISEYEVLLDGEVVATTPRTSYALRGLVSNTNYDVAVRSKSGSDWSEESVLPNIRTGTYPVTKKGFSDNGYIEITSEPPLNTEYENQEGISERRITDRVTMGGDTRNISKRYSKVPTFTADSKLCTSDAIGGSANRNIISTDTWDLVSNRILSTHMSYIDPKVSYYMTGNVFKRVDLDINNDYIQSDVYTFSDYDDYTGLPTEESKFSWDMKYVAFELTKGRTGARDTADSYWAVVFDLETNTIVGEREIDFVGDGYVAVSPSGKYCCVLCSSNTPTPYFRVFRNDGTMAEMPYGDIQSIFGSTGHGDFQKSIQGNDVFVGRVNGKLMMYLLDTGDVIDLIDDTNSTIFNIGHVGGQNCLQPGWIFCDDRNLDDYGTTYWQPIYRKIFSIQLDENVSGLNNSYVRMYGRIQRKDGVGSTAYTCSDPTGQVLCFNNFSKLEATNEQMYVSYAGNWNLVQQPEVTSPTEIQRKRNSNFGYM